MRETSPAVRWWGQYEDVFCPPFQSYLPLQAAADELFCFSPVVLPGQLQHERYARALLSKHHSDLVDVKGFIDKAVQARMDWQWQTFERSHPFKTNFIIDESALHRQIGGKESFYEQLQHLIAMMDSPHVRIQVLPYSSNDWILPQVAGNFMLLKKNNEQYPFAAMQEGLFPCCKIEQNSWVLNQYFVVFKKLRLLALDEAESKDFLQKLITEPTQPNWKNRQLR